MAQVEICPLHHDAEVFNGGVSPPAFLPATSASHSGLPCNSAVLTRPPIGVQVFKDGEPEKGWQRLQDRTEALLAEGPPPPVGVSEPSIVSSAFISSCRVVGPCGMALNLLTLGPARR